MLRPSLIEYIVVHELAHLTVMNHSADFWVLVAGALPDVQMRRRQLREAERGLPYGTLRFNWRVVMLRPSLIEYIVVHELAHLTVMNHSADFWVLVAGALPDVQMRRRQLREAERGLPF